VRYAGSLSAAAKCIDPSDKLRASSLAGKERVSQDDKGEHDWFAVVAQFEFLRELRTFTFANSAVKVF